MEMKFSAKSLLTGAMGLLGLLSYGGQAQAIQYSFDTSYCSIACTLPAGTVDVTDTGNNLHFVVTLDNSGLFRNNAIATFVLELGNLTGASIINIAPPDAGPGATNPWTQINNVTLSAINNSSAWDYGLTFGGGNHNSDTGSLSFDLTLPGTDLSLANLTTITDKNGKPIFFAAEVSQAGNTGFVGASTVSVPGPIAGAGLPGLIAACGGLIALARRRRQQAV
jgi:hypothetical protein